MVREAREDKYRTLGGLTAGADPRGWGGHGPPNGKIPHDYVGVAMKNVTSPSDPHNFLS